MRVHKIDPSSIIEETGTTNTAVQDTETRDLLGQILLELKISNKYQALIWGQDLTYEDVED